SRLLFERHGGRLVAVGLLERCANASLIVGMHEAEVAELTLNDEPGNTAHRCSDVVEQALLLTIVEQIEESARLRVIIVADSVVVTIRITGNAQRRLLCSRAFGWSVEGVRLVVGIRIAGLQTTIDVHLAVPVIVMNRAARLVDRDRLVMRAEAVTMC